MKTISFLDTGLLPTCIGYPAHFGPHVLLPETEFRIVWRFLRCNRCSFRQLYHKLVLDENVRVKRTIPRSSFKNAQPLHSLTRAIKTVLHGFALNRHLPPKLVIQSSGHSALRPDPSDPYSTTILQASFRFQRQFVVCPSHGRELFSFFYCEDDSDFISDVHNARSFRAQIIPGGHSHFFQSCALNTKEQTTEEDDSNCDLLIPSFQVFTVAAQGFFSTTVQAHGYCDVGFDGWHAQASKNSVSHNDNACSSRLDDINNKWNSVYQSNDIELQGTLAGSRTRRSVRFPTSNVVSKTHNLVTYATASRLERQNRIWELEAQHRFFDRYKQLLAEGHDPANASKLSQQFVEEDEPEHVSGYTASTSENCTLPPSNQVNCRPKKKRKRKRKRSSSSKLTTCTEQNSSWASLGPSGPVSLSNYQPATSTQMKLHV